MRVTKQNKTMKALLGGGLGFISGIAGVLGFYALGGDLEWDGGRAAAAVVGIVYLATGLFTLLGAALPRLGARLLNVSDVEELVDQRAMLVGSAVTAIAFGIMLLCLAGAGDDGFVRNDVAVGAIVLAFVVTAAVSLRQWRLYDELWRQLSWESSAFGMALILPVLVLWAAAVHLGYLASMDPLGVIAWLSAAILVGAVIATGRRGLLALK